MKWAYVLFQDDEFLSYEEVKNFLNARDEIEEWLHVPGMFFVLVSEAGASEIGEALLQYAKKNQGKGKISGRFLLLEVPSDHYGWLPKAAWNLIEHKSIKEPASIATEADKSEEDIPF